jgi:ketosteroid isomerase-like protein
MADDDALAVARRAWERWVAADLEGFLAMWAPDGVWTMAGTSRISGSHKGIEAIGEVARLAFELSGGTLKAAPKELAASGPESVLGYFHMTAEREDAALDQDGLQRMIIRDGKLVSLHNVWTDEAAVNRFYT